MKPFMMSVAALALMAGCGDTGARANADPERIEQALTILSLNESGAGRLSWAEKTVNDGSITFRQLAIAGQDDITIGSLVLDGVNMSGTTAIFDTIALNDMQIVQTTDDGTDIGMSIERLELDKPSIDLVSWFSGWLGAQDNGLPSMDDIAADKYIIEGIKFEVRSDDVDAMGRIGLFEGNNVDGIRLDSLTMKDLSLSAEAEGDDGPVEFEMKMAGFAIDGWNPHYLNAWDGDPISVVTAIYKNPLEPGYDGLKLDGFNMSVSGLSISSPELADKIERNAAGQIVRRTTRPYTLTVMADPDSGHDVAKAMGEGLNLAGYDSLVFNMAGTVDYDVDRDLVTFGAADNYVKMKDGFRLAMGGKVEGYQAFMSGIADVLQEKRSLDEDTVSEVSWSELTMHNIQLQMRDDGLIDRIIEAVAKEQDSKPGLVRSQMMGGIALIPVFLNDSETNIDKEFATDLTEALIAFVSGEGKTLVISFNPPKPMSIDDFEEFDENDVQAVISALGLEISTVDTPAG